MPLPAFAVTAAASPAAARARTARGSGTVLAIASPGLPLSSENAEAVRKCELAPGRQGRMQARSACRLLLSIHWACSQLEIGCLPAPVLLPTPEPRIACSCSEHLHISHPVRVLSGSCPQPMRFLRDRKPEVLRSVVTIVHPRGSGLSPTIASAAWSCNRAAYVTMLSFQRHRWHKRDRLPVQVFGQGCLKFLTRGSLQRTGSLPEPVKPPPLTAPKLVHNLLSFAIFPVRHRGKNAGK